MKMQEDESGRGVTFEKVVDGIETRVEKSALNYRLLNMLSAL